VGTAALPGNHPVDRGQEVTGGKRDACRFTVTDIDRLPTRLRIIAGALRRERIALLDNNRAAKRFRG
jgi:hypothetical protein